MQWNLKRLLIVAVVLAVWTPTIQAQQRVSVHFSAKNEKPPSAEQTLRWKNGDVLPGKLLESTDREIRWASPYFSDDLVVDIGVLDSVVFPKQSIPAMEAFRVGTVAGDIWIADIVDSDEETFLFSSGRHGQFRVKREAIYTLERRAHPNLIFDGSQMTNWQKSRDPDPRDRVFPQGLPERDANQPLLLFGGNALPDWYADRGGHPRTDKVKAKMFHALDWPQRFEIDLELASATRPPGFVFALGKNLYEALRLETWVNELVVVQGTLFEPVLTIQPDRRNFRLRLAYDGDTGVLEVFDFAGNLLLKLNEVGQTVKESGVYIFNRGQNLTVRRLRVYRQPVGSTQQHIDASKPRVHLMNGHVVYGKLFVKKESAYALDTEGNRHAIDIQQIDRVVQPGAAFVEREHPVALTYPDGAVLRGKIAQVNPEGVSLETVFANEPIECAFAGASLLRVESGSPKNHGEIEDEDRLFHPSGNLQGRVLFDVGDKERKMNGVHQSLPFIRWKPVGASESVRLAQVRRAHIERNNRRASKMYPFDTSQFRHILHLKSGEIIPCQISSYDEKSVGFQSPFISAHLMDSADVKALEFSGRTHPNYMDRAHSTNNKRSYINLGAGEQRNNRIIIHNNVGQKELEGFFEEGGKIDVGEGEIRFLIDGKEINVRPGQDLGEVVLQEVFFQGDTSKNRKLDVKFERALTVPRFSRDTPPSHILVAENGDMKRGKLLGFNGETIQFDSKLRRFSVPIERVARVVDVSKEAVSNQQIQETLNRPKAAYAEIQQSIATPSDVSMRLTDGSILMFEPLEIKDDMLLGRSSIYGEIKVPIESIQHLYLGDTTASFEAAFAAWVVRPAKEPVFGDEP